MKKLIPIVIFIVLVFIMKNIIFSINGLIHNKDTVFRLEQQIKSKELENKFLNERLKFVKSDEFIEQEAREKLGLSREGEMVVLFPLKKAEESSLTNEKESHNWKLWIDLLF